MRSYTFDSTDVNLKYVNSEAIKRGGVAHIQQHIVDAETMATEPRVVVTVPDDVPYSDVETWVIDSIGMSDSDLTLEHWLDSIGAFPPNILAALVIVASGTASGTDKKRAQQIIDQAATDILAGLPPHLKS